MNLQMERRGFVMKKIIIFFILYFSTCFIFESGFFWTQNLRASNDYYLQLDGVDDYFSTPAITYNKIVMVAKTELTPAKEQKYLTVSGETHHVEMGSNGIVYHNGFEEVYINGTLSSFSNIKNNNQKKTEFTFVEKGTPLSQKMYFFTMAGGSSKHMKASVYDIKLYNGTNLVAHYDMSTHTLQDISGNGYHATLNGGTWKPLYTSSDTTNVHTSIQMGSLHVDYQESIPVISGTITTDGTIQTLAFPLDSVKIQDYTGTGNGWNLNLQASPFQEIASSGGTEIGLALPNGSMIYKGVSSVSKSISTKLTTDAVIDDGSPVTIARATIGEGLGDVILTHRNPGIEIEIDTKHHYVNPNNMDENGATRYESVLTWELSTGP